MGRGGESRRWILLYCLRLCGGLSEWFWGICRHNGVSMFMNPKPKVSNLHRIQVAFRRTSKTETSGGNGPCSLEMSVRNATIRFFDKKWVKVKHVRVLRQGQWATLNALCHRQLVRSDIAATSALGSKIPSLYNWRIEKTCRQERSARSPTAIHLCFKRERTDTTQVLRHQPPNPVECLLPKPIQDECIEVGDRKDVHHWHCDLNQYLRLDSKFRWAFLNDV